MCDPISITAGGLLLASGGLAAHSQIQQGKAQQEIAKENARIANIQAEDALRRGAIEEDRYRRQLRRLKGTQRARFAASGVVIDQDSPLDVLADTAATGELDALTIRANAEREAFGFRAQAAQESFVGDVQRRRGRLNAAGTILGTAGSLLSLAPTGGGQPLQPFQRTTSRQSFRQRPLRQRNA